MRFLQIGYDSWWWQTGKTCVVIQKDYGDVQPHTKSPKHVVEHDVLTGLSWDEIERGMNKGYFQITPKLIRAYIKEHKLD